MPVHKFDPSDLDGAPPPVHGRFYVFVDECHRTQGGRMNKQMKRWLAHAIFAMGFFILSYDIVQAFLTTRSFSTIYSQEDLMTRLAEETKRAKDALLELKRTNLKLEQLATTDPLTGCGNRRQFMERMEIEVARSDRDNPPFSLL